MVTEGYSKETTTWLPEKYCKIGNQLRLKDNDLWSDFWTVQHVGQFRKTEKEVVEKAHNSEKIWIATSGKYPRGNK